MAASVGCYSPAYSSAGFSKHIVRGSHQSCTVKYSVPPSKSERVTLKLQLQTHGSGSKDSLTMKLYHSVLYIVQQINVSLQRNYMLSFSALYAKSWRFTVGFTLSSHVIHDKSLNIITRPIKNLVLFGLFLLLL